MKKIKSIFILCVVLGFTHQCSRQTNSEQVTDLQQQNRVDLLEMDSRSTAISDSDLDFAINLSDSENVLGKQAQVPVNPNIPSCANVTVVNGTAVGGFPKVITVDFGNSGCTSPNGVTRTGVLKMTISNKLRIPGSILKIERINYFVNTNKVEGTTQYQNITTVATVPTWSKSVTGGKITKPNGNWVEFTLNRKQKMTVGFGTISPADDVYEIYEGQKNAVHSNGNYLNTTVMSPLVKMFTCSYFSSGKLQFQGSNLNGVLDYGSGNCDNQATFTSSNGTVSVITL